MADYRDRYEAEGIVIDEAREENEKLRAENKRLREALEAVEWSFATGKIDSCPVCLNWSSTRHSADCKLGNALKQARGEK